MIEGCYCDLFYLPFIIKIKIVLKFTTNFFYINIILSKIFELQKYYNKLLGKLDRRLFTLYIKILYFR